MEVKSSNILIKTIIFILIAGLSCLLFFGLGKGIKTEMELVAFGFLMFAELFAYFSILVPSIKNFKKLDESDAVAYGILYFITNLTTNCIFFNAINTIKVLVIINVTEIIIFTIILCFLLLRKK